jgi:hypothetical protein
MSPAIRNLIAAAAVLAMPVCALAETCAATATISAVQTHDNFYRFSSVIRSADCGKYQCFGQIRYSIAKHWADGSTTSELWNDSYTIAPGASDARVSNEHPLGDADDKSAADLKGVDVAVAEVTCVTGDATPDD